MAKVELSEETKAGIEEVREADLLIAVAVPVDTEQLRAAATQAILGTGQSISGLRTVVSFPGPTGVEAPIQAKTDMESVETPGLTFVPYALPAASPTRIPWLPAVSTYQTLFAMARELGVTACAVIGFDLAALQTNFLAPMMTAVLEKGCELVMPVYSLGKFDGLLNSSIYAPLTRALYGRRVRFPLAPDFCLSSKMIPELELALQRAKRPGPVHFLAGHRGRDSRMHDLPGECGNAAPSTRRWRGSDHRPLPNCRILIRGHDDPCRPLAARPGFPASGDVGCTGGAPGRRGSGGYNSHGRNLSTRLP